MQHGFDRIKVRRNTRDTWIALNPILEPGEPGLEIDTNKLKFGDGFSRWSELRYLVPDLPPPAPVPQAPVPTMPEVVYEEVDPTNLETHVNSETPHPIYDDGPSLILLYQNAKV